MVAIAEADGNGADLADWAASTRGARRTRRGILPTSPDHRPRDLQPTPSRPTPGPVVAIVDANTFSCGDLFAAGILDHGIGSILSVGTATGAGGANVWTSDDIEYAYHAARRPLPPIPPGITFRSPVRRMTRTGLSTGLAIEDVGIHGNDAIPTQRQRPPPTATSTSPNAPPDSS